MDIRASCLQPRQSPRTAFALAEPVRTSSRGIQLGSLRCRAACARYGRQRKRIFVGRPMCASASSGPSAPSSTDSDTGAAPEQTPRPPWSDPEFSRTPANIARPTRVPVTNAMDFFRAREGTWASWRVTHHLAFRRSESGSSEIAMQCLDKDDERVLKLLEDHSFPKDAAQGGCYVTWKATMAWDQEGENHEGSTVFALVPDPEDERRGNILRDRGYAEIVPIAGTYYLDKEDALCLETPYDGGAVEERFCFESVDLLYRVSTVRRFGGLSNATFATERRISERPPGYPGSRDVVSNRDEIAANTSPVGEATTEEDEIIAKLLKSHSSDDPLNDDDVELTEEEEELILTGGMFLFSAGGRATKVGSSSGVGVKQTVLTTTASRAAAVRRGTESVGRPSPGSAFSSGFSSPAAAQDAPSRSSSEEAARAGIDLSKIPPSMRDDFERSFSVDAGVSPSGSGTVPNEAVDESI